jgi:hypothetical protein
MKTTDASETVLTLTGLHGVIILKTTIENLMRGFVNVVKILWFSGW